MDHPSGSEREPSAEALRVIAFTGSGAALGFTSGDPHLDSFLGEGQAELYGREWVGRTYLAFRGQELAAYYTVSMAEVRVEYLRRESPVPQLVEMGLEAIPALKVGRLAVAREFQGRGIGTALIRRIVGTALAAKDTLGVRFVVLQAKPASIAFYLARGFQLTAETRRERKRKSRTMFFDLKVAE